MKQTADFTPTPPSLTSLEARSNPQSAAQISSKMH